MKRILALMLTLSMIASAMIGCTPPDNSVESTPAESTPTETPESTPEATEPESTPKATEPESTPEETEPEVVPVADNFEEYRSNIAYGTGNNYMLYGANDQKELATFRAVFQVEEYGEFEYKLFFSNNVDGPYSGFTYYRDMPTADYTIHYAALRTTTDMRGMKNLSDPTVITFDGKESRTVKAKEMFWSDAVTFNVPEGSYLVYEWTVEYTKIPATVVASTYYTYKANTTADKFPKVPSAFPSSSFRL